MVDFHITICHWRERIGSKCTDLLMTNCRIKGLYLSAPSWSCGNLRKCRVMLVPSKVAVYQVSPNTMCSTCLSNINGSSGGAKISQNFDYSTNNAFEVIFRYKSVVGNDATVQYSWQRIDVLAVKIGVNSLSLLLDHCSAYRTCLPKPLQYKIPKIMVLRYWP